jgi:DNA polymerase-3 subunit gamma/tau
LENLTVTREAVTLLAQTSDGSLREAVQLLDQLAGDDISIDGIRDALILPKGELMQKLVDVILTANYAEYLDLIKTLLLGSTPEIILNQLTLAFRDLYLLSLDPKTNGLRIGMDGLREHGVDPETAEILLSILRQKSSLAMPNPEVWLEITILDLARVMGF